MIFRGQRNAQTHLWVEEGIFEASTLLGWINDPFLLDSTNRGGGLLPSHLIIPTMFAVEELKSKDSDHWTMRTT